MFQDFGVFYLLARLNITLGGKKLTSADEKLNRQFKEVIRPYINRLNEFFDNPHSSKIVLITDGSINSNCTTSTLYYMVGKKCKTVQISELTLSQVYAYASVSPKRLISIGQRDAGNLFIKVRIH